MLSNACYCICLAIYSNSRGNYNITAVLISKLIIGIPFEGNLKRSCAVRSIIDTAIACLMVLGIDCLKSDILLGHCLNVITIPHSELRYKEEWMSFNALIGRRSCYTETYIAIGIAVAENLRYIYCRVQCWQSCNLRYLCIFAIGLVRAFDNNC